MEEHLISKPNPNFARDHLANERTFLSWIRTAIALMGFGFVVVKFAVFLRQISAGLGGNSIPLPKTYSAEIGLVMIIFGGITAFLGYVSFEKTKRAINANHYQTNSSLLIIITVFIVLASAVMTYFLVPSLGI
ncbi:YidH family protein [Kaistella montana]|uniref:YidH family protein n=1 Tax=Kaistella montana TaxID=1849733 RepID=A0ABW5K9Y7_9FLAO|nr:DUF202 domain-containing protein [Kaistella montana]MCQ4035245.1 DUF202 domain-containing protein [Kaistella montana]